MNSVGIVGAGISGAHLDLRLPGRAACDHGAPAGSQLQSTHRTSAGTVAYARCPCGALLVLLGGQPLAAVRPRPRAATPPVPGERPRGRGRLQLWLWDHGQALWKWKWRQQRLRERADPRGWAAAGEAPLVRAHRAPAGS
jgi:hypothetical protein